jgi:hypothetical protein
MVLTFAINFKTLHYIVDINWTKIELLQSKISVIDNYIISKHMVSIDGSTIQINDHSQK